MAKRTSFSALPQLHQEELTLQGTTFKLKAVSLKQAKTLAWNTPEYMRSLIYASLIAGGTEIEGLTPESLEDLPFMAVYSPLFEATRRVNGMNQPEGEAKAATGADAA